VRDTKDQTFTIGNPGLDLWREGAPVNTPLPEWRDHVDIWRNNALPPVPASKLRTVWRTFPVLTLVNEWPFPHPRPIAAKTKVEAAAEVIRRLFPDGWAMLNSELARTIENADPTIGKLSPSTLDRAIALARNPNSSCRRKH
jgi:hypothetical protein